MCKNNHFYLTTPIYYPSDNLHIGHAYTTVAADTLKRFKKQMGIDAYFLTGSDEHGQKIERKAKAVGKTPKAYVDEIVANIKSLWKLLNVDYDDYIRTTDDRHVKVVQKIFKQLYDQGDIYLSKYEGLYCTTCEAFYTELQLKDGCCPDCGKPVEKTQEEAYFLKLSKYQDWLIDHIETHPDFIQPVSRKNEMLNNFLRPGLADLCVSRTSVTWGIPVEFNPKHTVYVWIDALSNYISALGYGSEDTSLFDKYWPCDVHFVGKEIIRFHTIIWPIILHAIGLPVPKQIFGHGWLVMNGQKMSKSLGNVIDPVVLSNKYGADAVRYYLMRAIPFGSDGQFSYETFLTLINADLSNTLGNLLSRTVAMIEKYFGGQVQAPSAYTDVDKELIALALATPAKVEVKFNEFQFPQALEEIWNLVGECNKYIDVTEPWILGKTEEGKERLKAVLYVLAECIRFIAVLITANMPNTPAKIYLQLGITDTELTTWDSLQQFGLLKAGTQVQKLDAIFPRVDIKAELAQLEPEVPATPQQKPTPKKETLVESEDKANTIGFDDFTKVQMHVGKVLSCEKVEKSDKLLKFQLDMGTEQRTIVSGIAKYYDPTTLVGKQLIVVTNLAPRKLRGIESQGMILSAVSTDPESKEEKLTLLTVEAEVQNGAEVG